MAEIKRRVLGKGPATGDEVSFLERSNKHVIGFSESCRLLKPVCPHTMFSSGRGGTGSPRGGMS